MAPSDVSQLRPPVRLDRTPGAEADAGAAVGSESRCALLVIGMHRSGTSAVTRVLSLCGARLPESLMPAGERNPRGYFESQRIYQLHEEMLAEAGSAWDDLAPLPDAWFESPLAPVWADRMADALRAEFGDARLVALKDPRIARLIPFWLRVLERAGYQARFVIPVRNPLDVAASLARAEGMAPAKSLLLWLGHLIAAERDTRGHPRSFVGYDDLLEDWRRVVARVADDLGIVFPRATARAAAEIDDFLAAELRHHASASADVAERWSVPEWVKTAHAWAEAAAAGKPVTSDVLDALGELMRPAELAFGPAVAAAELARDQAAEEARRHKTRAEHLAGEAESLRARLAEATRDAANAREDLERRDRENARITDWLKLLLAWAMREVHGGDATEDHLAAVLQAAEGETEGLVQIAALGIRLSHQSKEMARLAEEADVSAAEAQRLARELGALRAELESREPEREELARLRAAAQAQAEALASHAREAERASQQVRGLWQQLTARDGEVARLRAQVAELDGVRQRVRELEPLRVRVAELERASEEFTALRSAAEAAGADASSRFEDAIASARAEVAERDLYIETLRSRLAAIEGSRLWRAVRPFSQLARDAGAIVRR